MDRPAGAPSPAGRARRTPRRSPHAAPVRPRPSRDRSRGRRLRAPAPRGRASRAPPRRVRICRTDARPTPRRGRRRRSCRRARTARRPARARRCPPPRWPRNQSASPSPSRAAAVSSAASAASNAARAASHRAPSRERRPSASWSALRSGCMPRSWHCSATAVRVRYRVPPRGGCLASPQGFRSPDSGKYLSAGLGGSGPYVPSLIRAEPGTCRATLGGRGWRVGAGEPAETRPRRVCWRPDCATQTTSLVDLERRGWDAQSPGCTDDSALPVPSSSVLRRLHSDRLIAGGAEA